jgi:hypothetical protein
VVIPPCLQQFCHQVVGLSLTWAKADGCYPFHWCPRNSLIECNRRSLSWPSGILRLFIPQEVTSGLSWNSPQNKGNWLAPELPDPLVKPIFPSQLSGPTKKFCCFLPCATVDTQSP